MSDLSERLREEARVVLECAGLGYDSAVRAEDRAALLREAADALDAAEKAIAPFSAFAGEMFARNHSASDVVAVLRNYPGRLTAGDFFSLRKMASPTQRDEGE